MITRRSLLKKSLLVLGTAPLVASHLNSDDDDAYVMTVNGRLEASKLGTSLIHEHILVDFIGAQNYDSSKWNDDRVIEKVLPYLKEAKALGCNTFVDCTPNYLGRDVQLLKRLSQLTGLHIITNTGYYGGSDHKYLPAQVFDESPEQLAARWIEEWEKGIEGTGIKPGFIKISVNAVSLSQESKKLISAAALTHLRTGLTILSHTGYATPAFEQIDIVKSYGISPSAFVWVHAQMEKDLTTHTRAGKSEAWVSLDNVADETIDEYVKRLKQLRSDRLLHRVLISHDAGWYDPQKENGGDFVGYTAIFKKLIPALMKEGFTDKEVDQLMKINPAEAFKIRIRKM